jgi:pimeloyl-ACP methyl ester carboxylesterase
MKVVLIPGWNEASDQMNTFATGRNGIPALNAAGFDCVVFPGGHDALRPRVDRFARFLEDLREREPEAFPVATVGYSTGGLINRGFLRAYPERAGLIAATVQVATPNTGLISNYIANILRVIGIPHRVINDLDVASDFLLWLNGTGGHWEPTTKPGKARWKLNAPPWVAPAGHRFLSIAGQVPKFDDADGVVWVDSATLEGHAPSFVVAHPMANHLNLGSVFNIVAFVTRGFRADDRIWPEVVQTITRFLRGESIT